MYGHDRHEVAEAGRSMDAEERGQLLGPDKGIDSTVVVSRQTKAEHYSWACLWAEIKSVFI